MISQKERALMEKRLLESQSGEGKTIQGTPCPCGRLHTRTTAESRAASKSIKVESDSLRSAKARARWIARFGHDRCTYCGVQLHFPAHDSWTRGKKGYKPDPLEAQRDHAYPCARMSGFYDWRYWCPNNINPACRTCNIKKGARTAEDFRCGMTCTICGAPSGECYSTGGGTFKCPDL